MNANTIVYLVVLALCTAASGFFSGSETALVGISKERVHQLATRGRAGRRIEELVTHPERMLSTLLLANNLVNILMATVGTLLFISLVGEQWGPWVSTAVVTAVVLVFGEITPKTIAARYPEQYALAVAPTIWWLSRFLAPIANVFISITRGILRLLRIPIDPRHDLVTEDDIRALTELGYNSGHIEGVEREIIDALFDLADRPVHDVMTPRVDIVALTEPISMDDVRSAVTATGHSRFPVISGDLDDLKGMLYVKDLLQWRTDPSPDAFTAVLRRPHYVPETATILNTLEEMKSRRFAIGVVLDEHGGVEGVITAKDLLAELVGELQDEYDPGTPSVVVMGEGQWLADGRLPLEDLAAQVGVGLPDGPYSTVAGYFMALSGRVPQEGDTVSSEGLEYTVIKMERNRVDRISVQNVRKR
jgi:putative hemolysin